MWSKLDDKMHSHPKVFAAGNAAVGLWARLISWSGDQLTDGQIPRAVALGYDPTGEDIASAVAAGLLDETPNGYAIHDFLAMNPSRKEVEKARKNKEKAGRKGASKRWARAKAPAIADAMAPAIAPAIAERWQDDSSRARVRPDPTRPDLSPNGERVARTREAPPPTGSPDRVTTPAAIVGMPETIAVWRSLRAHGSLDALDDASAVRLAQVLGGELTSGARWDLPHVVASIEAVAADEAAMQATGPPRPAADLARYVVAKVRAPRREPRSGTRKGPLVQDVSDAELDRIEARARRVRELRADADELERRRRAT